MASPALRKYTNELLLGSSVLAGLGYGQGAILPAGSPDGPNPPRFCVVRWGTTTRGIGGVNRCGLGLWFYNKEPDYQPIADALKEARAILPAMAAQRIPGAVGEAIVDVAWEGDSEDLYDDGYRAWVRWTSHTITASGS